MVLNANCSEQRGGAIVVHEMDEEQAKALQLIWVDQGDQGESFAQVVEQLCSATVEVVKQSEAGFVILPKRSIVQRTFG